MCLSNGILVGLCYAIGNLMAQMYLLARAPETRMHLRRDRPSAVRLLGLSLVLTIPVAGSIKLAADWFFHQPPLHCMDRATFFVDLGPDVPRHVHDSVRDAGARGLRRQRLRRSAESLVLISTGIGLALSFIVVFVGFP